MEVFVSDENAKMADLVRRAEAGEDVLLTRNGKPVARILALPPLVSAPDRLRAIHTARAKAHQATPGADAARSQDFLYGDDGLPA